MLNYYILGMIHQFENGVNLKLDFLAQKYLFFQKRAHISLQAGIRGMAKLTGEISMFLRCPDVDPMHSPRILYSFCNQWLVSK